jgi:hypothetical protein
MARVTTSLSRGQEPELAVLDLEGRENPLRRQRGKGDLTDADLRTADGRDDRRSIRSSLHRGDPAARDHDRRAPRLQREGLNRKKLRFMGLVSKNSTISAPAKETRAKTAPGDRTREGRRGGIAFVPARRLLRLPGNKTVPRLKQCWLAIDHAAIIQDNKGLSMLAGAAQTGAVA